MLSSRLALVSLAVVAIVAVAACTSGSAKSAKAVAPTTTSASTTATTAGPPSPTTAPVTPTTVGGPKGAYIAAADAICDTMNERVSELPDPGDDATKQAQVTDQTAAIVSDTLHKLRALPVPPGQAAAVSAIYAKVDRLLNDSAKLSAAIRADNQAEAQNDETALQTDSDAANAASNAYGLRVCGA